jgi:hypothetical protein
VKKLSSGLRLRPFEIVFGKESPDFGTFPKLFTGFLKLFLGSLIVIII